MTIPIDLIARLPKVELHCHLDGSLRISTILDLAKKNKVTLPATTTDGLSKILLIGEKRTSLERYLDRFELILSVLQTPESLKRAAYELIEDVVKEALAKFNEGKWGLPFYVFDKELTTIFAVDTKYGKKLTMVVNPVTRHINFIVNLSGSHKARRRTLETALEYYNIGSD